MEEVNGAAAEADEDVVETASYWRAYALRVERERDSLLEGLNYVEDAVVAARRQAGRRRAG